MYFMANLGVGRKKVHGQENKKKSVKIKQILDIII